MYAMRHMAHFQHINALFNVIFFHSQEMTHTVLAPFIGYKIVIVSDLPLAHI